MRQLKLLVSALCLIGILSACATTPMKPRNTVITTRMSDAKAYSSVLRALAMAGYLIQSSDKDAGLINTRPKEFKIARGIASISYPATVEAQVLIADHSVSVQTTYKCSYGDAVGYQQDRLCIESDSEASEQVQIEDANLRAVIQKALQ